MHTVCSILGDAYFPVWWKFWIKIGILAKFFAGIFVKKRNVNQKSEFLPKTKFWPKIEVAASNRNFDQQ